jgi:NAD(P)H-hydrate epimerase
MLKLFSVDQIREADRYTIANEPIASIDLMERAALAIFKWIEERYSANKTQLEFHVVCGAGNNGGDGLALARILHEAAYVVSVSIFETENYSEDHQINRERLPLEPTMLNMEQGLPELKQETLIIDAIFGTGLSRKTEGAYAAVIQELNAIKRIILSIDIPSGLFAENNAANDPKSILRATYTLSFQFPKLSFLLPENSSYVGDWSVLDIGLSEDYIAKTETPYFYIGLEDIRAISRGKRQAYAHKGNFGHALLLAGSRGKMGAVVLAAKACLRSGVGLLTLQCPSQGEVILQTTVPEAMCNSDENETHLSELKPLHRYSALGVGPGIGMEEETQALLKVLIQQQPSALVLDADALNILAKNSTWLSFLPKGSILTPHPGEFKRLVGNWDNDYERLQLQREFAQRYGLYVLVKGRNSSIATPEGRVFFNSTGNPGMASGGSGDVLTGIITALLAQGYQAQEAIILGVYVHGLAGDLAAEELGEQSLIASDIIAALPEAFSLVNHVTS